MKKINIVLKCPNNHILYFNNFSLDYKAYKVCFKNYNNSINIEINSEKSSRDMFDLFLILHKMIFLNYGYFMVIKDYRENNISVDYKKHFNLEYIISDEECAKGYCITSINELITPNSIKRFEAFEQEIQFNNRAYYYLKSEKYTEILIDHKLIVLLQMAEGLIENTNLNKEIDKKYNTGFRSRLSFYINILAKLNKQTEAEIFEILKTKPELLLDQLTNFRHMYSHYIKKDNSIDNDNIIYYLPIIDYLYRIAILEMSDIKYDHTKVKQFLYSVHDWILSNSGNSKSINEFKSSTYKISDYL